MFRKKPQYVPNPYVQPPAPAQPSGPTMDNTINNASMRTGNLDARIEQLEVQIAKFKKDMNLHRPGTAAHNTAKRRALQALRQKKSLENRVQTASQSQFNLEQVRDAQASQRDHIETVKGMKQATKELQKANQQIDLDQVEDIHDEMEEALEDVQQVDELLGRQYEVDNIDQSELEAELNEFEDESIGFASTDQVQGETPSYLLPTHQNPQPQHQVSQQNVQSNQHQQNPAYAYPQGGRY